MKWYVLALAFGAVIVTVLSYLTAYHNASRLADGSISHYWVAVDVCHLIANASLFLIGSAFFVGLTVIVREAEPRPLALAPVVGLLVIAAITATAAVVSWYGSLSTTEMTVYGGGLYIVRDVAMNLGVGVGLAAVLYLIRSRWAEGRQQ